MYPSVVNPTAIETDAALDLVRNSGALAECVERDRVVDVLRAMRVTVLVSHLVRR